MKTRHVIALLAAGALVSGCGLGQSRLNPFNWFSSGDEVETVEDIAIPQSTDSRPLIPQVTSLVIERTPGGAIVRAIGLPGEQGWYDAALVSETRGEPVDGILTFAFRARPPASPQRSSTVASREIVVGRFVSDATLAQTREIRIVGAANVRASRR